jgi:hypothetical protein
MGQTPVVNCPFRIEPPLERRPANALNVEIGTPMPRCTLKPPDNWARVSDKPMVLRWLNSGGSPLVLGNCSKDCPKEKADCAVLET